MSEKEKLSDDELQQVNGGKFGYSPINPGVPLIRYSRFYPTGQKDEQGRELCGNRQNYPHCGGCTDFCENGWRSGHDWPMGR